MRVGGVPATPGSFSVLFVDPDITCITWMDALRETYYRLVSSPSSSVAFIEHSPHSPSPENATYHEHEGIQPGEVLCFKLSACNDSGCSPETLTACAFRVPTPPYVLQVQLVAQKIWIVVLNIISIPKACPIFLISFSAEMMYLHILKFYYILYPFFLYS